MPARVDVIGAAVVADADAAVGAVGAVVSLLAPLGLLANNNKKRTNYQASFHA